jgi:hypothetical protein
MNKKLITISLISGTVMFTGIGIVMPELSIGMGSLLTGGTSLGLALQVLKESAKRKINKTILQELR